MSGHINAVKANVIKMVDSLESMYDNAIAIRVGFVAYRDYMEVEQFIVSPFSSNASHVLEDMSKVYASGGGDTPEDVHGGLEVKLTRLSSRG